MSARSKDQEAGKAVGSRPRRTAAGWHATPPRALEMDRCPADSWFATTSTASALRAVGPAQDTARAGEAVAAATGRSGPLRHDASGLLPGGSVQTVSIPGQKLAQRTTHPIRLERSGVARKRAAPFSIAAARRGRPGVALASAAGLPSRRCPAGAVRAGAARDDANSAARSARSGARRERRSRPTDTAKRLLSRWRRQKRRKFKSFVGWRLIRCAATFFAWSSFATVP